MKLSRQEIIRRIAEEQGLDMPGCGIAVKPIPNYPTDEVAMRNVVRGIPEDKQWDFVSTLCQVYECHTTDDVSLIWMAVTSTAKQLYRAYLAFRGWEEVEG